MKKLLLVFLFPILVMGQGDPVRRFNTLAELAAYAIPSSPSKLSALVATNGVWFYNASSVVATNTYNVIKPNASNGRWVKWQQQLASTDFPGQGTTGTVFHGNAAAGGAGSFGAVRPNEVMALPVNTVAGGGVTLQDASITNIHRLDMAAGIIDLWTVPSGQRAYILSGRIINNSNTTANVTTQLFKTNGNYFATFVQTAIATNATLSLNTRIILEQGESFSISNSAAGLSVVSAIIYYPNTIGPYSPRLMSLAVGFNTIYTVPSAKQARLLSNVTWSDSGTVLYSNYSGAARMVYYNVVPSGSLPSEYNRISAFSGATTINASQLLINSTLPSLLSAGDYITVNTDVNTATQFAWVNVLEY